MNRSEYADENIHTSVQYGEKKEPCYMFKNIQDIQVRHFIITTG